MIKDTRCVSNSHSMSQADFKEVQVFEDDMSDFGIIKSIVNSDQQHGSFYILDVATIVAKHKDWITKMPRVTPHYAVKCNPDSTVIKILSALNAGFDCASEQEIKFVMQYGVSSDRIIFANPAKLQKHIKFAKKVNVSRMTVDSELELLKIKDIYPEAKIVIRIRCDAKDSQVVLGTKFGCDPGEEAIRLIQFTKNLGLNLHGFSFHVGSPCGELNAYGRGIAICNKLITVARSMGCNDVKMIDIGGGIPGQSGSNIEKLASIVNSALEDVGPDIKIISEPGRYYVTSAFTLATSLHSKRLTVKGHQMMRMYYVSCGVYTAFIEELLDLKARVPMPLYQPVNDEKYLSTLWGPTCDSYDCIVRDVLLPEFHIGDWMVWRDMGAYTLSISCPFNGFASPVVYPVIRKSQWKDFNIFLKELQRESRCIEWNNGLVSAECVESR